MGQFLTVIVKPTLDCNLRCRHCYHRPSECSKEIMSESTFERTVKLVREGYDASRYIWHGGEPLLIPMSFYKKAFTIQKKYYGKMGTDNTIQTNGTLLNTRFIEFCKTNRVNLGISYESGFGGGLRPGMDEAQIDSSVKYMVDKNHMFLISATIHGGNVNDMGAIYDRFKSMGASLSFNPVISLGCAEDCPDLALDPDIYVRNSIELFDRWIHDVDVKIPVLPFYPYIMTVLDGTPNISDCPHASCLTRWICVYPNGDVYPCGKACPKEFCMGNINEVDSVADLFESEGFRNILIGSIERRKKCQSCEIYQYCNGGCSIDALADVGITEQESLTCRIYKGLLPHIKDVMEDILENRPDMNQYNGFVKDAVLGKLINPQVYDAASFQ